MEPVSPFDTAFWLTTGGIAVLLMLSAFFSGSETALTAASRGKLRAQADRGSKGAAVALRVTEDSERLIGAVLLGNNVVNILSASLATALLTRIFGDSGVALATLVMTALVLIFSEVLPKTWAITMPETAASIVARPIRMVVILLSPVVSMIRLLVRLMLMAFGVRTDPDSHILSLRGRGAEGGPRPASRRARPLRPHGGGGDAPPLQDRDDRP
jgi:Mg2+/Co2+ transporter CorB